MGTGYSKKKKQAKAMQQQFAQMQEELKSKKIVGTAGSGLVSITLNGENEMEKIEIKPECVDPEDVEVLEDLIMSAHNDACKKLQEESSSIPGMPDMSMFGM